MDHQASPARSDREAPETAKNLSGQGIDDSRAQELALDPFLTSLDLSKTKVGVEGVAALARSSSITVLSLARNEVTEAGCRALAANTTLTALNLSGCDLYGSDVSAFARNSTLTALDLASNDVSDESVIALASNDTLLSIDFRWNINVEDAGAVALSFNTTLTSLRFVCWGSQIGTEGVRALASSSSLTYLDYVLAIVDAPAREAATLRLRENRASQAARRRAFLHALLVLAFDSADSNSLSWWRRLPADLRRLTISQLCEMLWKGLGVSSLMLRDCARLLFAAAAGESGTALRAPGTLWQVVQLPTYQFQLRCCGPVQK